MARTIAAEYFHAALGNNVRSTTYNALLEFRDTPFGSTPDPQFFYFNPVYREALATLADGFATRNGLMVVTGEPGTGKTTLLRQLVRGLDPKFKTAYVFNTLVSFTDLLHLILTDLGLPGYADDKLEMIGRLNDYLLEQDSKGHIVVLLIDEAQDLSLQILQELRLLANLETDQKKLLQIALIGQPELERKLDEPELWQLNQRVTLRCRLAPLAADEVESYMDSRLRAVAQRSAELFERDAIKKIGLYSNGIPRLINILCNNALLISDAAAKSKIDKKMIDEVAADLQLDYCDAVLTPGPDSPAEYHIHKNLNWLTISPLLISILIGLGGFLYSQKAHDIEYAKLSGAALQKNSSNLQPQIPIPISQNPQPSSAHQSVVIAALPTMTIVPAADQHLSRREIEKFPAKTGNEKQPEHRPPTNDKPESDRLNNFEVVGASFVRNQPSSNADIIATLEPGTRVVVARRSGEYYWVRSMGSEPVRGYVHREDAFFERSR